MKTKRKFSVKYTDVKDKYLSFNDLIKALNENKTIQDLIIEFKIKNNE